MSKLTNDITLLVTALWSPMGAAILTMRVGIRNGLKDEGHGVCYPACEKLVEKQASRHQVELLNFAYPPF
jgi:hypothetical protein